MWCAPLSSRAAWNRRCVDQAMIVFRWSPVALSERLAAVRGRSAGRGQSGGGERLGGGRRVESLRDQPDRQKHQLEEAAGNDEEQSHSGAHVEDAEQIERYSEGERDVPRKTEEGD